MLNIIQEILKKINMPSFYLFFAYFITGIIVIAVLLLVHAYITGREIKCGLFEIKRKIEKPITIIPPNLQKVTSKGNAQSKRIMLLCGTTKEIEDSPTQSQALHYFYKCFILEMERTPFGINTCGAEPLRKVIIDYYCEKLYHWSKQQINEIHDKVRWYYFLTDTVGFNYEPAIYQAIATPGVRERTMMEYADSDIIVAFTGNKGLREQIERLLKYHKEGSHHVNLNRKPLIILGWFGGSAMDILQESLYGIDDLVKIYSDLNPLKRQDLTKENAELLASHLVAKIRKLLT